MLTWRNLPVSGRNKLPRWNTRKTGKLSKKLPLRNRRQLKCSLKISVKRRENAKGQPWTIYTIKGNNGEFRTFDLKTAEIAKDAKLKGLGIKITYKSGQYGNEIESLEAIMPTKAESEADDDR